MVFAVAVLVAVACGFALLTCLRRLVRVTAVAALEPQAELRRLRAGQVTSLEEAGESTVVNLRQLLRELHASDDPSVRTAVQRELVLTLQAELGPSTRMDAGLRRIPVAAGVAGTLLTVWDDRAAGLAFGGVGAVVAVCCAVCTGHAERRRRRAFEGWKGVLDSNLSARGWDYSRTGGGVGGTSSA